MLALFAALEKRHTGEEVDAGVLADRIGGEENGNRDRPDAGGGPEQPPTGTVGLPLLTVRRPEVVRGN